MRREDRRFRMGGSYPRHQRRSRGDRRQCPVPVSRSSASSTTRLDAVPGSIFRIPRDLKSEFLNGSVGSFRLFSTDEEFANFFVFSRVGFVRSREIRGFCSQNSGFTAKTASFGDLNPAKKGRWRHVFDPGMRFLKALHHVVPTRFHNVSEKIRVNDDDSSLDTIETQLALDSSIDDGSSRIPGGWLICAENDRSPMSDGQGSKRNRSSVIGHS